MFALTKKADTLSRIVGTFQKTLTELDAYITGEQEQAEAKAKQAAALKAECDCCFGKVDRAQRIRANIERLIEEPND